MKRRDFVTLASLAGVGTAFSREAPAATPTGESGPVLGCQRAPTDLQRLQHFKRHGVDHICGYPDNPDDPASWTVESLTKLRERCVAQGVALDMIQFPSLSSASIDRLSQQHPLVQQAPTTGRKGEPIPPPAIVAPPLIVRRIVPLSPAAKPRSS